MSAPAASEASAAAGRGERGRRLLLLVAAGACAACALVYQLALVALGGVLIGASVVQTSLVIALFVFALGIGALAAKPLLHRPLGAFVVVEVAVAVAGGASVLVSYWAFAWLDLYTPAVVVVSLLVGGLVGAELPLLMALLQRTRRQEAARAMADLNAADYVGALAGGLAFPFVLLPAFGQIHGALAAAVLNLAAAALIALVVFGDELRGGRRVAALGTLGAGALALGGLVALAAGFEADARQRLYDAPIALAERTPYQEIVITRSRSLRGPPDTRLFLNGDLQFSSRDEYRYHEALVHPALAAGAETGPMRRVLVLGGGDGLAVREILRRRGVEEVRLVDLDPAMTRLGRDDPRISALNRGALRDPRVRVTNADAFRWVRDGSAVPDGGFDAVIADFPDPDDEGLAKLYSVEFYGMLARRTLRPGGALVVQSGSPYFAAEQFWTIRATVAAAGLRPSVYHVDVPSFGDWGYVLARTPRAGERAAAPAVGLGPDPPRGLRFLSPDVLRAATVFPPDRGPRSLPPSTLDRPRVLDAARRGWGGY